MALTGAHASFVAQARTATLGTIAEDGRPRLVPICFVLDGDAAVHADRREAEAGRRTRARLARVRDIERATPRSTVLVDRWDEDWTRPGLAPDRRSREPWPRIPPNAPAAIAALRAKYPQYAGHDLEHRPLIRIAIERVRSWGDRQRSRKIASPIGRRQWVELIAWR